MKSLDGWRWGKEFQFEFDHWNQSRNIGLFCCLFLINDIATVRCWCSKIKKTNRPWDKMVSFEICLEIQIEIEANHRKKLIWFSNFESRNEQMNHHRWSHNRLGSKQIWWKWQWQPELVMSIVDVGLCLWCENEFLLLFCFSLVPRSIWNV